MTDAMAPGAANRDRDDDLVFPPEDLDDLLDLRASSINTLNPGCSSAPMASRSRSRPRCTGSCARSST